MDDYNRNPDLILKSLETEDNKKLRGQLHIFFGYAAGVGKTYAMLKAAHKAQDSGFDTVIGYVEPHMRPETSKLLSGLVALPVKTYQQSSITLHEFDLDAALKRHPQLLIVDELAHTNANGCRHEKRYQDIQELLDAGINVYTTINVQHIESLNDIVAAITGVVVKERIPDKIFDEATQVKLVDIEPQELIDRLNSGKIYQKPQVKRACSNFFTIENLTALREIALRRCADRMNYLSDQNKIKNNNGPYTDEHILVCLSSSPSNEKIIRNAARMAKAFHGKFTALFVETRFFPLMSNEDKKRLQKNTHLASQLGATIETTYGDDVSLQISEFARLFGVSKIVLGRSSAGKKRYYLKQSLVDRLISYSPNLDIYVIPDSATSPYHSPQKSGQKEPILLSDIIKSTMILTIATAIGFLFYHLGFSEANIITVYILGVLVTAVITTRRLYSLVSSVLSVLVFNFFFTIPRFTLNAYDSGYPATFLIMFLSAFLTSTLAVRIKRQAKQAAASAYRTKLLLDTSLLLSQCKSKEEIIKACSSQLVKLLHKDVIFYLPEGAKLLPPVVFPCSDAPVDPQCISENEKAVASWVYKNNRHAGASTSTLSNSQCFYLAVRVCEKVYAVAGFVMNEEPITSSENSILLSILGETALALESDQTAQEKEKAAVLAKNEQLRANLLRSISHDLRTPLTSISGNANILMTNDFSMSVEKKNAIYTSIYDDAMWLNNLIENLLSVTRIEDGSMHLKMTTELVDEIIDEALQHVSRKSIEHTIVVNHSEEFLLAKMDARLIMQVIINIVDNAIKYTNPGSLITISSFKEGKEAIVTIADNGPGIPEEAKPHIFDMFYTAEKVADSRRSLGLGLALCKSIITVHHGNITVSDVKPSGTIFRFSLPIEEVTLHE